MAQPRKLPCVLLHILFFPEPSTGWWTFRDRQECMKGATISKGHAISRASDFLYYFFVCQCLQTPYTSAHTTLSTKGAVGLCLQWIFHKSSMLYKIFKKRFKRLLSNFHELFHSTELRILLVREWGGWYLPQPIDTEAVGVLTLTSRQNILVFRRCSSDLNVMAYCYQI